MTATVWADGYSQVEWDCPDASFIAVMNVDARFLPGSVVLSARSGVYFAVLAAGAAPRRTALNSPDSWPGGLPALNAPPAYVRLTAATAAPNDPRWSVFDALVGYWAANRDYFLAAAAERAAGPPPRPPIPPALWPRPVFKRIRVVNGAGNAN